MTELAVSRYPAPTLVRGANITAKAGLLILVAFALAFPDLSNLRDKAAGMRAIGYPMLALTVPLVWFLYWRERVSFPWLADLMVTITCFTDILGNQMNLYDTVVWFDDWMHFMNTGLLAGAVILLTMHRSSSFGAILERALAFGATAAIGWELAEFFAFIRFSPERHNGYADTLGDLTLGMLGAIAATAVIHALWRQGSLSSATPLLTAQGSTAEIPPR